MTTAPIVANFQARQGCSFEFKTVNVTNVDFNGNPASLLGTVAVMEFGSGFGSAPRLVVRSDELATLPAIFDWTPTAEGTGALNCKLSPTQVDTIGPGQWFAVIKVVKNGNDPGTNVEEMTLGFEVVRWPAAVE